MLEEINTGIFEKDIRDFAFALLAGTPDYFFTVAASSSGKYHPVNDLGEGGLVRHSISVKRMLDHILCPEGYYEFTDRQRQLLRVAALIHDSFKSGRVEDYEKNSHTKFLHPLFSSTFVIETAVMTGFNFDDAKFIADAVISHMGQWNTSTYQTGTLPKPETPAQKVLHLADYLASRKDINMDLPQVEQEPVEIDLEIGTISEEL